MDEGMIDLIRLLHASTVSKSGKSLPVLPVEGTLSPVNCAARNTGKGC